jgi:Ser/Thr protein kinase RdoA (MazF antagonist)
MMMRLAEIHRLTRTADDAGRSPVADVVAAAWGVPPGTATRWRSSASHVFVIPQSPAGRAYLRLIPADHRPYGDVLTVARLMRTLGDRGLAVAQPVPATSGALVETVPTPLGTYHAMVVKAAPGGQIDVDGLTPTRASQWGQALARLHRDDCGTGVALPAPFLELARVAEVFPDDPSLVVAADSLAQRLTALPRDDGRFGTVHGDFELDNLCWDGDAVVAYDFDEAARSWFVADIAYAVRDLAPVPARTPRPGEADLFAAFLAGYRSEHPLPEPDLAHLPLFAAAQATCSAVRAQVALDAGDAGDPPWLVQLRGKLRRYVSQQRDTAVAWTRTGT